MDYSCGCVSMRGYKVTLMVYFWTTADCVLYYYKIECPQLIIMLSLILSWHLMVVGEGV